MGSVNTKKSSVNVKKILDTDFSPAKVLGLKKSSSIIKKNRKGKDGSFHFNLDHKKAGLGGRGLF